MMNKKHCCQNCETYYCYKVNYIFISAKCPTLTNPISGSVSTSTDGLTTTAAYECAQLYELVGEPTLTCLDTGSWNHAPPICSNLHFYLSTETEIYNTDNIFNNTCSYSLSKVTHLWETSKSSSLQLSF